MSANPSDETERTASRTEESQTAQPPQEYGIITASTYDHTSYIYEGSVVRGRIRGSGLRRWMLKRENSKEAKMDMKFSELIEARRSVRKYTKPYFKNPRKPVAEVLKAV